MHKLVLIRHGESTWNWRTASPADRRELTPTGVEQQRNRAGCSKPRLRIRHRLHLGAQARHLDALARARPDGPHLAAGGQRLAAQTSATTARWQGLNKAESGEEFGDEQVLVWRRSYDTPPRRLEPGDPRSERGDLRLRRAGKPAGAADECLKDTVARVLPYWNATLAPAIRSGRRVLIAAHGNSIRALVKVPGRHLGCRHRRAEHPERHPAGLRARCGA